MIEYDYIMRMIKDMLQFLRMITKQTRDSYELPADEENYTLADFLYKDLMNLLKQGKINEAENLLFDKINTEDKKYFLLALDFYEHLNSYEDEFLEKNNFTREEIKEGLKALANKYGIIGLEMMKL